MPVIINGTTGVTFPNGVTMSDGTSAPVTIAQGGTGANTAANARTALGTNDAANITTGTIAIANGGTGANTAAAAFNAINPMTTTGDILYEASPTTAARLGIGSTGQILTVSGGIPAWAAPPAAGDNGRGQAFTSNGTFTIPSGTTAVKVTIQGGGGGSGSAGANNDQGSNSGAGGGGGTATVFLTSLTPGNTISVTIGGGGSGGSGSNGGTGGTSSIASGTQSITTVSASGGGGGTLGTSGANGSSGGGGGTTNATFGVPGGPGTSTSGGTSILSTAGGGFGKGGDRVSRGAGDPGVTAGQSGTAGIVVFEF
jgi:hypothetical protein